MRSVLCHSDVFMPNGVQRVVRILESHLKSYQLSRHLEEHLDNDVDRSHFYLRDIIKECIESIHKNPQDGFEVELSTDNSKDWYVTKYCIRVPYSVDEDVAIVIRPRLNEASKKYDFSRNLVVTAWLNHKSDAHYTLDESKYCNKERWEELQSK